VFPPFQLKGLREGGVNPPLPRNCEGNETHTKTGSRYEDKTDSKKRILRIFASRLVPRTFYLFLSHWTLSGKAWGLGSRKPGNLLNSL